MTNRLKLELLKLQLRLKHNNPDVLVFEEAKVNLRKLWLAAYAEAGVPKGVRLFYSVRHAYAIDMANKERMEKLLQETIAAAQRQRALKPAELRRVTVDTTVQEKAIAFPTDARLYQKARCVLVREAKRAGLDLRQSYAGGQANVAEASTICERATVKTRAPRDEAPAHLFRPSDSNRHCPKCGNEQPPA